MTTFSCPRCGRPSAPEQCPNCGRGPEPLLMRLGELDAALLVLTNRTRSRAAAEAERAEVLQSLRQLAASYRAQATPPSGAAPAASPGPFPPALPPAPRPPAEMSSRTVQTLLLSLGGLLVAAAVIIFTAVAWRHLGDSGRLAVLAGFTGLLLIVPPALLRFDLRATAETFGALAALALWCSALAGHFLLLPTGGGLTAAAIGTWTLLVLAVLAAYRAGVAAAAPGWAMAPLAAVGAGFSAAADTGTAAALLLGTGAVLAGGSWVSAHRPSSYPRSDLRASRLLLGVAVVLAFGAGLRVALSLGDPLVPVIGAVVALLASANLVATVYARQAGASAVTLLAAWAATVSLAASALVLAVRAEAGELAVPVTALLGALLATLVGELAGSTWRVGLPAAGLAVIAGLAGTALVTTGAPDLVVYLGSSVAVGAASPLLPEPLRSSLRRAGFLGGAAVGAAAAVIALGTLPVMWAWARPEGVFTWEVPLVLALVAFGAVLLPPRWRLDLVAHAAAFALVAAAGLLWYEVTASSAAVPIAAFGLATLIALVAALGSATTAGRCAGWAMLVVWMAATAGAVGSSPYFDADGMVVGFALSCGAAAMLAVAVGAPRRSRTDRVLAAILAHVLAGATIAVMLVAGWFAELVAGSGQSRLLPAALGVYTLALVGAALMAPVRHRGYAIAAMATGTVAWWALLASYSVTTLEWFTLPPAALVFAWGVWRLLARPEAGSWAVLAAPIALGLAPSLLLALGGGEPARRVGVGAAALVVVIAGIARRWQAPLVLGSAALVALTANELVLIWHLIPVWIPPAIGGAVLILAGATLEQRRRDLSRLTRTVRAMR